ncbi:hypothetical protein H1R20_g8765, partial [Candolleomyces eurysporus]
MRVSFATLIPVVVSLTAWATSAHRAGGAPIEARDWMDGLSTRDLQIVGDILERRELLAQFSTRDIINALIDRVGPKKAAASKTNLKKDKCPSYGKQGPGAAAKNDKVCHESRGTAEANHRVYRH